MSHFIFEMLPILKGKKTGIVLNENEMNIISDLRIKSGLIDMSELSADKREILIGAINKINKEVNAFEICDNSYYLTEEGKIVLEEIGRFCQVTKFYQIHPYIRPAVTVDGIIFFNNKIVLIERRNEPFRGKMALPGGYVNYNEKVEDAFLREMREEIGRDVRDAKIFTVVSDPGRDPRGHTISIVFTGVIDGEPIAGDDASKSFLFTIDQAKMMSLAFDHQDIIKKYDENLLKNNYQ